MHLPAVGKQIGPIHVVDIGGVVLVRSSAEFRSSGGPPVLRRLQIRYRQSDNAWGCRANSKFLQPNNWEGGCILTRDGLIQRLHERCHFFISQVSSHVKNTLILTNILSKRRLYQRVRTARCRLKWRDASLLAGTSRSVERFITLVIVAWVTVTTCSSSTLRLRAFWMRPRRLSASPCRSPCGRILWRYGHWRPCWR